MDQTQLPAHSGAKIKLLSEYLEAYLSIISRDRKTRYIQLADVFCGPGKYKDKVGSPVAIARILAAMHKENSSAPKSSFLANDGNKENIDKVEQLVRPLDQAHPNLNIVTSNKDAKEIIDTLKKQKLRNDEKRFLFIDPFGYKDVLLEDILSLLADGQTELLLFQPSSFMFRFSRKGTPSALEGILSSLSNGEEWPSGLDLFGYIRHTKTLLEKQIGDSFYVDTL